MAKPRKPKNDDAKPENSGALVRHQKLCLSIDIDRRRIYGHTELEIAVPEIGIVGLHAENLGIGSVLVDGEAAEFEYYPHQYHEESEKGLSAVLTPSLAADAASSAYITALERELVPNLLINCCKGFKNGSEQQPVTENGFHSSTEAKQQNARVIRIDYWVEKAETGIHFKDNVLHTDNQIRRARCWFPCIDDSSQRCCYDMEFTVAQNLVAVSNGNLKYQVLSKDDPPRKTYVYSLNVPVAAQWISLAVAPFEILPDHQFNLISHICLSSNMPKLRNTMEFFHSAFSCYKDYLLVDFPFESYKQVFIEPEMAVSSVSLGASMSIFSSQALFDEKVIDQTIDTRIKLAYALARQWFGVYITPEAPNDEWLLDGLAGFLTDYFIKKNLGNNEARYRRYKANCAVCKADYSGATALSLSASCKDLYGTQCIGLIGKIRSWKAVAIIQMLEKQMGPESFRNILQTIVSRAQDSTRTSRSLSTKEFRHLANKVGNLERPFLKDFFPRWVGSCGCPVLRMGFSYNKRKNMVELAVLRGCTASPDSGASVLNINADSENRDSDIGWPGMMSIRIYELDGMYDHPILPMAGDIWQLLEIQCHSKLAARRFQKPKKGSKPDGSDDNGDVMPALDMRSSSESPLLWMRADPEMEYLAEIHFNQPLQMWINQLEKDKDVIAQAPEVLLRNLKNAMRSVKFVLEDAEEKQHTDSFVKGWVDDLKDVIYDAEDILDEIATEALQRKLDAESSTTALEKVLDCISNTFLDTFVNEVEPKIEEVLDRLDSLVKEKDFMGLQAVGVGGKQYPDQNQRLSTSYVSEFDTFGRDEDKKKVIDLLLSSDARGNEMFVIAIVGMGGIGKTTLAQMAYNDSRVQQHFNLKIWFCVSEEFDVPKVEKSIIDQAETSSARSTEDPEQLQVTLKKSLMGKKFLLVLDDVWSEKPIHREFLGQLLQYGARGSTILVTTRNGSVALAMHAIETHHLKLLLKNDCWSLFEKHAFRNGSSDADPKIKEIGTQIVKKCKGLPLAIKAIGNLLWSESNVKRWTNILKSNLWDLQTDILPALRLSYNYLPSYLKRCFAYCSIFPKDHFFKKDELVLLWMAEGFLQQSETETMEEIGNHYFDTLVSRSLFQQSSHETNSGFVMHDLVNDLAKFVAGQFGTDSSKKIVKMTRYVSDFDNSWCTFQDIKADLLKAKQLRTFLASSFSRLQNWENKMQWTILCLRVLSLRYIGFGFEITKLPDSIGEMKYLRYLDVSWGSFNRLPDSICNLCNLQTLKLSGCSKLDRLPRDMWKLINLRHLEIDHTPKLKEEMPIKMGRLNCLQTLSKFIVSKHDSGSGSSIGELGKLKNLRGELSIEKLQNVRSADDALDASLKTKGSLEELALLWDIPLEEELGISESQRGVLENLQPHKNLKSLTIKHYSWKGFPDWIGGLTSLSKLELFDCKYCSALPPLGHLPFLEKLSINGLDGVVTVGPEFYGNSSNSKMKPFGSLKFLMLRNMSNLKNWLPSLDQLEISNCQHLEGSLSIDSFPVLTSMKIIRCDNLESVALAKQDEHDGLLSKLKILLIYGCKKCELPMHRQYSSLEVLYLKDCCDSLTSFPLDLFPNLKSFRIEGCRNLQSLEQHGGDLVISKIGIWRCPKFVSFPKGGLRAPNLALFSLKNCESLRSMPDKMHILLPSLRYLELVNCPEVESFPEEGLPSNLKKIAIFTCKKLIANPWKETLPCIEWLEIGYCELEYHVESFPGELLLPTTLTYLCIGSIGNLKSLDKEGFQHLTSLVQLDIFDCPKLRYMPEQGFSASLRFLQIEKCDRVLKEELESKKGKEWLKVARVPNIMIDRRFIQGDDEPSEYWASWYDFEYDLKFEHLLPDEYF